MVSNAGEVVRRARLTLGTPFRPHGRTLGEGLDCVGVAALAYGAEAIAGDYALRGTQIDILAAMLAKFGFTPVAPAAAHGGDLAVFAPGPGQLHLAVLTGTSLIHADLALRKVVERPMPAPWPLAGLWRLRSEGRDI